MHDHGFTRRAIGQQRIEEIGGRADVVDGDQDVVRRESCTLRRAAGEHMLQPEVAGDPGADPARGEGAGGGLAAPIACTARRTQVPVDAERVEQGVERRVVGAVHVAREEFAPGR